MSVFSQDDIIKDIADPDRARLGRCKHWTGYRAQRTEGVSTGRDTANKIERKDQVMKGIVITAVIVLSMASGYLKGKKKLASLVALGVILGIYVAVYLMK